MKVVVFKGCMVFFLFVSTASALQFGEHCAAKMYRRVVARLVLSGSLLTLRPEGVLAAAEDGPSASAIELVSKTLAAVEKDISSRESEKYLSESIEEWKRSKLASDELAGLLKLRADGRTMRGEVGGALEDLNEEIVLLNGNEAADAAELPRALLARARLEYEKEDFKASEIDAREALEFDDALPAIEKNNPYTFELLGKSATANQHFEEAGSAFSAAQSAHASIGDYKRAAISATDAALAQYADTTSTLTKTLTAFALKEKPITNNPDDIGILQELSRKDAELHLAYAARLARSGKEIEAIANWELGCIRLNTYKDDVEERVVADDAKELDKKPNSLAKAARGLAAVSSGLDPESPYLTQRPGQQWFWYELRSDDSNQDASTPPGPEGDNPKRRRIGTRPNDPTLVKRLEPDLSCANFGDADWLKRRRPDWPPSLRADAASFYRLDILPQQQQQRRSLSSSANE